jgi:hypothetical protein
MLCAAAATAAAAAAAAPHTSYLKPVELDAPTLHLNLFEVRPIALAPVTCDV